MSTNPVIKQIARAVLPVVPISAKRRLLYYRVFRKPLPRNPQSFLDKIHWRVLNDRRNMIARGGDKIAMKEHAAASGADVLIPETIWHGISIAEVVDTDWGQEWVLKPRTGSGYVAFGSGSLRSSDITVKQVQAWRHRDQYRLQGEWAYGQGEDGFFLEARISTSNGDYPNDIRFFVFDGTVRLIQVDTPRFHGVHRRFYTPQWEPFSVTQGVADLAPVIPRPYRLSKMIQIAEAIGQEYDFIRVDLYDAPDGIYFGELTPYPTGGLAPYSDEDFNFEIGSHWILPDLPKGS